MMDSTEAQEAFNAMATKDMSSAERRVEAKRIDDEFTAYLADQTELSIPQARVVFYKVRQDNTAGGGYNYMQEAFYELAEFINEVREAF